MRKVALAFFTVAPIYGLFGMAWGVHMGMSGDHGMMPAHAHLNLLGLVLMGVMGAFYALAGERVSGKLAWANFILSNLGVLFMIPTLVLILGGNETPPVLAAITVGELGAILGLACFLVAVLSLWRKPAV